MSRQKRCEKKKEMGEKEKLSIIDWCETHLALLTAISSILGIGVTGLFKFMSYWYEKGYYDFWGIPINYIEIDYNNILMLFLLNFSGIVIIIAVGVVYIEIYNLSKIWGKVFLYILLFLINGGIMTLAIYRVGGTINDAFNFSNHENLKAFIIIQIILYMLEVIIIFCFKDKKPKKEEKKRVKHGKQEFDGNDQEQKSNIAKSNCNKEDKKKDKKITEVKKNESISESKEKEKKIPLIEKKTAIYILIFVFGVIVVINWICYDLYIDRKDKCKDTKKFEVMSDDGKEYVILAIYADKYFVKPCSVCEEKHSVIINSDKYKLIEMGVNEVTIYDFSKFEGVFTRLNNDEFINLQNDCNPLKK